MSKPSLHDALRSALALAGDNQSKFAAAIGTSQQSVSYWLKKRKPLPAEYVLAAERAGYGSRYSLRPDVYLDEYVDASAHGELDNGHDDVPSSGKIASTSQRVSA
jgi:DNA-binding transcriptional regulator YdaS (Cro superfamily)